MEKYGIETYQIFKRNESLLTTEVLPPHAKVKESQFRWVIFNEYVLSEQLN